MKVIKYIILVILVIILGGVSYGFAQSYSKDQLVQKEEQERKVLSDKILEGATVNSGTIDISYKQELTKGNPMIFGGSHAPEVAHQDAWNKIAEVGVTSIRKDFFMERAIPNTTIADYKNNVNGVADPKNWKQSEINQISDIFKNAKSRGMKRIGILAYLPGWLTYTNNGNGVPKDWAVFEDITKKTYQIHRDNVEYVEIWNEPNFEYFLNPVGSGLTADEAYAKMYYHASKAIREVDIRANDGKYVQIGGPVGYDPIKTSTLDRLLKNKDLHKNINFISYHNYEGQHLTEPSWTNYKQVMAKHGINRPIYITEWNYWPDDREPNEKNYGVPAIVFTGNKFINFLKMGLAGANYHVLEPLKSTKPNGGIGYYGFYKWEYGYAELVPQSRTWRLLSNKMALGKGASSIYAANSNNTALNSVGFINVNGQKGVAIVNASPEAQMVTVKMKDTNISKYAKVSMYYASGENDAKTPMYEGHVRADNGSIDLMVYVPQQSVVGLTLAEESDWFDFLHISN